MNPIHSSNSIVPSVHATKGDDINFDQIEREVDAALELKQERAAHEKTLAALSAQTAATQRLANERQIERALLAHPGLSPKAVIDATSLLLAGDAGELEAGPRGLREKFGTRDLNEVVTDFLRGNPHFTGNGSAESAPATPNLDRATMSVKQKADYISEHGQEKYLSLPYSKDVKK